MEMYAAPGSRGGVLEPSGIISIKYRKKHQIASMHRLDDKLIAMVAERRTAEEANDFTAVAEVSKKISVRENLLLPVYRQIAEHFADLHDCPGRMLAKGVIPAVIPWEESRAFFYHRLNRRLAEFKLRRSIQKVSEAS
jgi:acetyl-CoA carboxylase / biotin carboxylase 1